jgi:hypothetical protein
VVVRATLRFPPRDAAAATAVLAGRVSAPVRHDLRDPDPATLAGAAAGGLQDPLDGQAVAEVG